MLERELKASGLDWAILRPTVLFGAEDILINNIAWMLRRFPLFGVFGDGEYRLQPVFVGDLASLAVSAGTGDGNLMINVTGPETFTFRELVSALGSIILAQRPVVRMPPGIGYLSGRLLGAILGDLVVTREEIAGLMAGLLFVDGPSAGATKLTEWARANADTLGVRYASELGRRR